MHAYPAAVEYAELRSTAPPMAMGCGLCGVSSYSPFKFTSKVREWMAKQKHFRYDQALEAWENEVDPVQEECEQLAQDAVEKGEEEKADVIGRLLATYMSRRYRLLQGLANNGVFPPSQKK